ncbi:MAG: methylenetetrahydrofolate reductase C-terminal domain-containing protein [Candidatus Thorarchaeota archaeon]|jgi:hypothetical protein
MIVVKLKPFTEIASMLGQYQSILVVGCDGCSGIYEVGGLKQAEILKQQLELARELRKGGKIRVKTVSIPRQCDVDIVANKLRREVAEQEAILSLGCGVGVQTLADIYDDKPVFPALDTMFIGMEDKSQGKLFERCKACGDCILAETGGICPITRCAKGLLNGPCGGTVNSKCEVYGYARDCAWILIWTRLKQRGMMNLFTKFRPFRVNKQHFPRELEKTISVSKH